MSFRFDQANKKKSVIYTLMFASKHGKKNSLKLTGASATNLVASNSPATATTDQAIN